MKYQRWHDQIIERARYRTLDVYKETHHVLPRAMGGDDNPDNLVDLTYREHFLIHWLLTKTCTNLRDRMKMVGALHCMTLDIRGNGRIIAGWQIDAAKRALRDQWIVTRQRMRRERREVRRLRLRSKREEITAKAAQIVEALPLLKPAQKSDRGKLAIMTKQWLAADATQLARMAARSPGRNRRPKRLTLLEMK